jgi:hypothetical protein
MKTSRQLHAPAALPPGKKPPIFIGEEVGYLKFQGLCPTSNFVSEFEISEGAECKQSRYVQGCPTSDFAIKANRGLDSNNVVKFRVVRFLILLVTFLKMFNDV